VVANRQTPGKTKLVGCGRPITPRTWQSSKCAQRV